MTAANGEQASDVPYALEIARSLTGGDHVGTNRNRVLSLAVLLLLLVSPRAVRLPAFADALRELNGAAVLVLANPVAHGRRLAESVLPALPSGSTIVCDTRLSEEMATDTPSIDFPAFGIRSLWGWNSWPGLLRAIRRYRSMSGSWAHLGLDAWPFSYRLRIFLTQSIRFDAARAVLDVDAGPRLFVADFDRSSYCWPIVAAASRAALGTATLVHGSPNATAYVPVIADNVLVWGPAQATWFGELSPHASVHEVGRPDLMKPNDVAVGQAASLVICHSLETLSEEEIHELLDWQNLLAGVGVRTTVRLHPSVAVRQGLDSSWRSALRSDAELVSGRERPFGQDLAAASLVAVVSSTAAVDALVGGVPVIVVADENRGLPCDLRAILAGSREAQAALRSSLAGSTPAAAQDALARFRSTSRAVTSCVVVETGHRAAEGMREVVNRIMGAD